MIIITLEEKLHQWRQIIKIWGPDLTRSDNDDDDDDDDDNDNSNGNDDFNEDDDDDDDNIF